MTYGVSADQMLFLSEVLDAMKKDEEGFRLLSRHGWYMYVNPDDYCLSVEWVFDRMRIAIDIAQDIKESGWSLSSTREAGNHSTGAYLSTKESIESAVSLIYFILKEQKDNLDREVKDGKENKD